MSHHKTAVAVTVQGLHVLMAHMDLSVAEFPVTWLETKLQPLATCYLKKWSGLARPQTPVGCTSQKPTVG